MTLMKRTWIGPGVAGVSLLLAAAVGAATIAGTPGNDTLRGGAAADKLNGKGGNDRLYGFAGEDALVGGPGNDVLAGGPGDDVLVGGAGADRLSCGGGGFDIAKGDAKDRIGKDCEVVMGVRTTQPVPPAPAPPPPSPSPPAVTPITPGSYQGATQNGNFVFLTVSAQRTFTGMRINDLPAQCGGGGYLPGGEDFGDSVFPIKPDGTFEAEGSWDGSIVNGDLEFTHWDGRVAGRFDTATSVTGTIVMNYGIKYQGTTLQCSSGQISWSATLRS